MNYKLKRGDKAPIFSFVSPWAAENFDLERSFKNTNKVLIFLRYHGCLICQLDIRRLVDQIALFKDKDAEVFLIIQSSQETIKKIAEAKNWPFHIVCDPKAEIYEKYNIHEGNILQFLHPSGLPKVIKSLTYGHRHGKFEGKEMQLPGIFVLDKDNQVCFAHYGSHISDIPSYEKVAENILV